MKEFQMFMPTDRQLLDEAQWIHMSLFSAKCPPEIQSLYLEANHYFKNEIYTSDCSWLQEAVQKNRSPLNLEFFLRFKSPNNSLSKKMKIILYLCELEPTYQDKFKNSIDRQVSSYFLLMGIGLISAYRLICGALTYLINFQRQRLPL